MNKNAELSSQEKREARRIIQEKTGHYLKSTILLNQAFRRSSFASEHGMTSNENFELIGDQVLGYFVMKIIADRVGSLSPTDDYTFRIKENRFTQIEQSLVNNESLANITLSWGVIPYLRLGKCDIKNEVIKGTKVQADLFEAILGAIALDCEWNSQILEQAVRQSLNLDTVIDSLIQEESKARNITIDNAVTVLKELAEAGHCTMPTYEITPINHLEKKQTLWCCQCRIIDNTTGRTKTVLASSKKEAKKAAAYLILCEHLNLPNQYGPPHHLLTIWNYNNGSLLPDQPKQQEEK